MKDKEKLLLVAEVYSLLNGIVTPNQLQSFLIGSTIKFKGGVPNTRAIGKQLSLSRKFERVEKKNNVSYYKVIA